MKKPIVLLLFIFAVVQSSIHAQTATKNKQNLNRIRQLWERGALDSCLSEGRKLLSSSNSKNNDTLKAMIYTEMGIAYEYKGSYPSGLQCYFKAEKLIRNTNDLKTLGYIYSNIGLIYGATREDKKALGFYKKSLAIRKKINDLKGLSACYNNMAIVFMNQSKTEKAIFYYKKSLKIDEDRKDSVGAMDSYNNLGVCYMDLKKFEISENYLKKSYALGVKLNSNAIIQNVTNNFGRLYFETNKLEKSRSYLIEGLKLSKENGNKKNTSFCLAVLKLIAEKQGNYKEAFDYQTKEIAVDKELIGESNIEETARLEVKYEYEKKQEIEKEKLARSEAERKVNSILLGSTLVILLFVIFMSLFLYRKWKLTQEQKKEIAETNHLLNEQNTEIVQSINYAKRIQYALLPSKDKLKAIFPNYSLLYLPKDIVSGDFYWSFETLTHHYFAVADCTGHGVPGALMNMICHNALNRSILEFDAKLPGEILDKTREIVVTELSKKEENMNDGMDISLLSIEKESKRIDWSGAYNDLWICRKENSEIDEIKALKQPIGKHFNHQKYTSHTLTLMQGDRLVLFTDGFADQFGGTKNKKFKNSSLKNVFIENQQLPMHKLSEELNNRFNAWKGKNEQIDDVCIVCFEVD
jgi:serine phosphatase RsbU (regulator of sigma subunit)